MAQAGGVLQVQGPGLGQLAAGVDLAGQHVEERARAGLAAQPGPHQALAVAGPAGLDGGAAAEHDDQPRVGAVHGQQQVDLVLRQLHVAAVEALALLHFVQP